MKYSWDCPFTVAVVVVIVVVVIFVLNVIFRRRHSIGYDTILHLRLTF